MRFLKYVILTIAIIGFIGCGEGGATIANESEARSFKVNVGEDVTIEANQTLTVFGLVVSEDDVGVQSYTWAKDNTVLSRKASLVYVPQTVGKETLTLTVILNDGRTATDSLVLTVTEKVVENIPPTVELGLYRTIDINRSITFTADVNDSDGSIVKYVWTKNNEVISNDVNYSYVPTELGEVNLGLTVTDDDGAVATDTLVVLVTKRAFITEWKIEDKHIIIPINDEEKFDFTVEWGDGTFDTNVKSTIAHEYKEKGTYGVRITGLFPSINFGKLEDKDKRKLLLVKEWGATPWSSMKSAFSFCEKMNIATTDVPNLSNVTDMSSMFLSAKKFNADISKWDVSNVKNMQDMFSNAWAFNQPLGDWDVSNVINMSGMFSATVFDQNIGDWNVSNVVDMSAMFGESAFNQAINRWDVSNVIYMDEMFVLGSFNQDISDWNVSNAKSLSIMLYGTPFSTINYDKLLIKWSQLSLPSDVYFEVDTHYTINAKESRDLIISKFNWTLIDGGLE